MGDSVNTICGRGGATVTGSERDLGGGMGLLAAPINPVTTRPAVVPALTRQPPGNSGAAGLGDGIRRAASTTCSADAWRGWQDFSRPDSRRSGWSRGDLPDPVGGGTRSGIPMTSVALASYQEFISSQGVVHAQS